MLVLGNNIDAQIQLINDGVQVDCVYADCIYENEDFSWLELSLKLLKDDGVIYIQTDHHTDYLYRMTLERLGYNFINEIIYIQEWGGYSKRRFPRKHDTILMYSYSNDYMFEADRIRVPKATKGTAFDKNGKGKIPMDVFYDLGNFSTMSKERVKMDGKNIQWQKPLKLMDRLLLPVTNEGDLVLDPFFGSGTTGVWCESNKRNYIGIEYDNNVMNVAKERLNESN